MGVEFGHRHNNSRHPLFVNSGLDPADPWLRIHSLSATILQQSSCTGANLIYFSHKRVYKIANVIESECYHPAAKFLYRFLRFLCSPSSPPDATAPRRTRSGTTPTTPSGRPPRSGFFPEESSHPGPALQHRRPATNHVIAVKRL